MSPFPDTLSSHDTRNRIQLLGYVGEFLRFLCSRHNIVIPQKNLALPFSATHYTAGSIPIVVVRYWSAGASIPPIDHTAVGS